MGIVIGTAIILGTLVLSLVYGVKSNTARKIQLLCLAAGAVMMFSVHSFDSVVLVVLFLAELVLSSLLLMTYRAQLRRDVAVARRRAEKRARARRAQMAEYRRPVARRRAVSPQVA